MKVVRADILGFCFGVRRAVELAQQAISENSGKKIYSLGPLIHNETVLSYLEKQGLNIIDETKIQDVESDSVVIIRAHGTSPKILEKLNQIKCTIVDATCPRVKNSQNIVHNLSEKKDFVIFTGDKNHGEVKSIEGYGKENFILVQNLNEAEEYINSNRIQNENDVLLLSQTTFSAIEFNKIAQLLKNKTEKLEVKNTICPATKERQDALVNLCTQVDGVIVIGGKNSANSLRLFQIAEKNNKKAAFIQNATEIPEDFYKLQTVGITAGASTPDQVIEEVEKALLDKSLTND